MPIVLPRSPTTLPAAIGSINAAVKINPAPGTRSIRVFPVGVSCRFGFEAPANSEGGALVLAADLVASEWLEIPWDPGATPGAGFYLELTAGAPGIVQVVAAR